MAISQPLLGMEMWLWRTAEKLLAMFRPGFTGYLFPSTPLVPHAGRSGRTFDHAGTLLGLQSKSAEAANRPHPSQTYFRSSILPLQ